MARHSADRQFSTGGGRLNPGFYLKCSLCERSYVEMAARFRWFFACLFFVVCVCFLFEPN